MEYTYRKAWTVYAVVLCFVQLLAAGCTMDSQPTPEVHSAVETIDGPDFRDMYRNMLSSNPDIAAKTAFSVPKVITMSVAGMPLREVLVALNGEHGIAVVCDASIAETPVTLHAASIEVESVLTLLAAQCQVHLAAHGNAYYLGNHGEEERAFLVRKVRNFTSDGIDRVLQTLLSEAGRIFSSDDGIIVVGDRAGVLRKINSMLDSLDKQAVETWILQMYLISSSGKKSRDLGFDTKLDLNVGLGDSRSHEKERYKEYEKKKTDAGTVISNLDISAVFADSVSKLTSDSEFRAILKAARSSSKFKILAEPMMLIVDGGEAKIRDGEKIPIPRKAISDSGTVTTTGYDYIDTGIIIAAAIREVGETTARCNLSVDLTQINGYVEGSPITTGQTFSTTAILESGGTYLVGSMSKRSNGLDKGGALVNTYKSNSVQDGSILIWMRCYRIRGDYLAPSREATSGGKSSVTQGSFSGGGGGATGTGKSF